MNARGHVRFVFVAVRAAIAATTLLCASPRIMAASDALPEDYHVEKVLGFQAGDRPVTYEEMSRYLDLIARSSDRARVSTYGTTDLQRSLRSVTLSSPANLARIDRIDAELTRLAAVTDTADAATAIARTLPAVVWIGYGTHADELSGSDAALGLIDELVTGQDDETLNILDHLIVHVDPMVNPDGREHYLAHVTGYARQTPVLDSQDIIQNQPWPSLRLNHYLMDLNRDALFATQAQSVSRISAIRRAHPQLFIDAHEMIYPSTHLFALPGVPLNPYIPASIHRSWERFGADISRAYDAQGKSYYTRSWDEVFYPGYYDILPAYSGITPLLYEQARTSGVSVTLPNGKARTFAEAVANQLLSSRATLTSAANHRLELMDDWLDARRSGSRDVGGRGPHAWLVPPEDDFKVSRLLEILAVHEIRYQRLAAATRVSGLHSASSNWEESLVLPAGTVMVRTNQPSAALVRNIFGIHVPMDEAFLRTERQRLDLGLKTQVYDVTAWSLPLAFDLTAYWTNEPPAGAWRDGPASITHREAPAAATARYGYIYEDPSLFVTARLLQLGVTVRVASEPFELADRSFPAGAFLVRNDDQVNSIVPLLAEASATSGTRFRSIEGARTRTGPDLGDDKFVLLRSPRVAILMGSWTQATNVGAMWHVFDQEIRIPATMLDVARLEAFDLSRYNVLLLPDAEDNAKLAAALAPSADSIRRWIQGGGTLVVQGGGATAAGRVGLTAVLPRASLDRDAPLMLGRPAAEAIHEEFLAASGAASGPVQVISPLNDNTAPVISEAAQATFVERRHAYVFPRLLPSFDQWADGISGLEKSRLRVPSMIKRYLPHGAYLRVDLKPMHWLRYGVHDRLPALFREEDALIAESPTEIVGRYAAPRELALSGLIWPESVGYLAETAYLTRERQGRGQVISFANDAVYRGYSLGTQRLLLNAVILGPGMRGE